MSVRAAERVGTVYDLFRVYNPFEWSVPTVWAGYGVVLTTSELPIVGCVGKGLHTNSCIANALCSMCVVHVIFPSRRVRWSLLSTFVLTLHVTMLVVILWLFCVALCFTLLLMYVLNKALYDSGLHLM